jgi:hypothetical protein
MTDLQRKALASLPLPADEVETIHRYAGQLNDRLRRLCVSHERLRAEVLGATVLLAEAGYLGRRWAGEPNSARGDSFRLRGEA